MADLKRGDEVVILDGPSKGETGLITALPDLTTTRYTVRLMSAKEVTVTPRHLRRLA